MANNTNANTVGISIGMQVTGGAAVQAATQQIQQLNGTIARTGSADMARPVQTLRQELRQATNEVSRLAAQGQQGTLAFRTAATRVTELKNGIDEMNNSLKAFDPDNKFRIIGQGAQGLARGMQVYTSALALAGVESEELQETLVKLQAISGFADGIDSLLDLQDTFKNLLLMLGLNVQATNATTVANTAQTASVTALTTAQTGSLLVTQTMTIAENDLRIVELNRIATLEATAIAEAQVEEARLISIGTTSQQVLEQQALTIATLEGNAAARALATGQTIQTVATEGTTLATKALKIGLYSLGIGAVIALVAYLVTNWDSLSKSLSNLFPKLGNVGNLFNKFVNIASGVGSAIANFLVRPFTALYKLLSGDMKGAMSEIQKAFALTSNFNAGKLQGEVNDAKKANKAILEDAIKTQESRIKLLKASGKDTTKLERDLFNKKLELNKEDSKKLGEVQEERALFEAGITKKSNDEAEAKAKERAGKEKAIREKAQADFEAKKKADLDSIKKNNEDALRIIQTSSTAERTLLLNDLDVKYKKEFELLEKRKKDIKDYNIQFSTLTQARKTEEQNINKKFDDDINSYLKSVQGDTISSYQKTIDEINKVIDEKLKNATPDQIISLNTSRDEQINKITTLQTLDNNSQKASTDLSSTENTNRANDNDTPEQAALKIQNINAARLDAENAAFELKKMQLQGQNAQLLQLNADHESAVTGITDANAKARQELAEKEKDAKLATLDAVGAGLNAASGLLGENTAESKIMSVAAATISTYTAIAGQLASFSKVPIPGYAIAQAAVTGVAGLAAVKNIMKVKVPSAGGGAGAGSFVPPQINSTILSPNNSGSKEIVNAVQAEKATPVEAIITVKSLKKYQERQDVISNQSTY